MNKIKIIAIIGRSGAGKDTLKHKLLDNISNAHDIVACTTRPMREYEVDGKDYYFIDLPTFTEELLKGNLIEASSYNHNSWFYGTAIQSLDPDKINIGVFNPNAYDCMKDDKRLDIQTIYVYATDKTRLMRSLNREDKPDCHEVCRRFLSEDDTYANLEEDGQYIYFDNTFEMNIEELLSKLDNFIK